MTCLYRSIIFSVKRFSIDQEIQKRKWLPLSISECHNILFFLGIRPSPFTIPPKPLHIRSATPSHITCDHWNQCHCLPAWYCSFGVISFRYDDLLQSMKMHDIFIRKPYRAIHAYFVPQQASMSLPVLLLFHSFRQPSYFSNVHTSHYFNKTTLSICSTANVSPSRYHIGITICSQISETFHIFYLQEPGGIFPSRFQSPT